MTRAFLQILLFAFLGGCSILNPLYDEKAFENHSNSLIGQDAEPIILTSDLNKPKYSKNLGGGEVEHTLVHSYTSSNSGKNYKCLWAITVDESSGKIVSWRYIDDPSMCKSQYFYGGAW